MYHSMIMSHIRYGITVWHHGQAALRKKVQACANKFLRMIFYMNYCESVKPLMTENKILSVNQIHFTEVAKIMNRVMLGTIPVPFIDVFDNQIRTSTMVTRHASMYYQRTTTLQKCKQAISYTGPFVWNSIPVDVKHDSEVGNSSDSDLVDYICSKSTLKRFTRRIKKYALENVAFI